MNFTSTKIIELGSCAFRQWRAGHSHCKYIHGYRLIAKFWFNCSSLDDKNWVVDFGGLDELKSLLQHQFDHTFCVAADDPQLDLFKQLEKAGACELRIFENGVGIERTAEYCFNLANEYIHKLTNGRCWVDKVEVWEHEKNSAIVDSLTSNINMPSLPEVVKNETPKVQVPEVKPLPDIVPSTPGARVGPAPKTTGWSNPFAGTSWGS